MSPLITDTEDVTRFCGVSSDVTLAHDVGDTLGCREAESLAGTSGRSESPQQPISG